MCVVSHYFSNLTLQSWILFAVKKCTLSTSRVLNSNNLSLNRKIQAHNCNFVPSTWNLSKTQSSCKKHLQLTLILYQINEKHTTQYLQASNKSEEMKKSNFENTIYLTLLNVKQLPTYCEKPKSYSPHS